MDLNADRNIKFLIATHIIAFCIGCWVAIALMAILWVLLSTQS